jgi:hypothetical protein
MEMRDRSVNEALPSREAHSFIASAYDLCD